MIVTTNIPGNPGRAPRRPAGMTLWASIDVEWTKNYRIKNGNQPFCYSVVYAALPRGGCIDLTALPFSYTSVYIESPDETAELLASANAAVRTAFADADHVTGHQLCADLGVLTNASTEPLMDVASARESWKNRRSSELSRRRVIDTRYDAGHVLACESRRLVDVCTDLRLDVTQPELGAKKSMTALHRAFIDKGSVEARERISVLNLRHSLSTALVAFRATGQADWTGTLNVNRLLADQLDDSFGWLSHPSFTSLL